ncbi:DNA repair protein RecN [Demequina pelophila]|uniref:DNA repair protein RecN n=1 Tax=Demequina pelophila TaxID=1638984 RepID=UPI000783016B|nr:DNA repair protein RecN [Demequina pelophila]
MLDELSIENLGVIEAARLPLRAGLTVVTGETGAGKTMVLTGLGLILGAKAVPGTIRGDAEEAVVEAVLGVAGDDALALVEDAGGRLSDGGEIIVTRTVGRARSRATLGGRTVPQALLSDLAEHLVTVHGQADQGRLRSAARQRDLLDEYAGEEHRALLAGYREAWAAWTAATRELERMRDGAEAERAEARRLRDDLRAIEEVEPVEGEDEAVAAEARALENVEAVRMGVHGAHEALAGDAELTAAAALEAARRGIGEAARHDESLSELETRAAELAYLASDLASDLLRRLDDLEADPARLDAVHRRRSALNGLLRRLGTDLPGALEYWERAQERVAADDGWDARLAALEEDEARLGARVREAAEALTASRTTAATALAARVAQELRLLAMKDAAFAVEVTAAEPGPTGADVVAMTLAAHPGAEPRPVAQAASGGELSRIMLALEVALADHAPEGGHTFVFDEVDAGVGGRAAVAVGQRLAALARTHQVIVVTHLAQVAAHADHHLVVAKSVDGGTTRTAVREVDGDARVEELARLLSGHEDSATARAHAHELWEAARVAP